MQVIAVALGQIERCDLACGLGPHYEAAQSVVLEVGVHVGTLGVGKLVVGRVVFHRKHYGLHIAFGIEPAYGRVGHPHGHVGSRELVIAVLAYVL